MRKFIFIPDFLSQWPSDSEQSLRWYIRQHEEKLLKNKAIAGLGRRIGIDPPRVWESVDEFQDTSS